MSKVAALTLTVLMVAGEGFAQSDGDVLKHGFENPPSGARPRVWWHWMNGNITQEGIKLDLEWMHRVGIAGFQNFDATLSTPQVVEHRLAYMTPPWQDAFRYATKLADQLGMEEAIAGSPGWSETGGPWVPASEGMKKYVWSETAVEGGKPFRGVLAAPPSTTGPFQSVAGHEKVAGSEVPPHFYRDVAVVAYKLPASDVSMASLKPKISFSGGSPDPAILTDGDLDKTTDLPVPSAEGQSAWIQYEFSEPQNLRAVTLATKKLGDVEIMIGGVTNPESAVEASDDGQNFRLVKRLSGGEAPQSTVSFASVTATYFRVTFKRVALPTPPSWAVASGSDASGRRKSEPITAYKIAELVLHPGARVNQFEEKAAFVPVADLYELATPSYALGDVVEKADVVELTKKMGPDGSLEWTPPAGNWVILRFGYSLLGITNHPATAEATGLEVDKLNAGYVKKYMNGYLDSYKATVGAEMMGKKGIRYVITDSWEAGSQNWTDDMVAQFKRRRGYDPTPWMPVLAGEVVESSESSDRFLWDLRKTISDLIADEHYGQVQASLRERGIGHYGESHEGGRAFVADGMEVKKLDDIPMAAMWTQSPGVNNIRYGYNADDRESASVAHIYGQNIVAAESMTAEAGPWAWAPDTLKPTADQELLNGINRFVIHESAHQPLVGRAPGLTLGPYGQWFNRNETWAEEAAPWIDYLARSSYLLQQGHYAADVLYFYGEDSNLTAIFDRKAPDVPAGYGFDYINADGLIHEFKVSDGKITTTSGMNYRVLALDPYSKHMSLPVLRAIAKLVSEGAVVAGPKPQDDPSLSDDQAAFHKLADQLFGDGTGMRIFGRGKVFAGESLADVFKTVGLQPDFDYASADAAPVLFAHRHFTGGDLYFIDNRSNLPATVDASFRINGKLPELWYAETGRSEAAGYTVAGGRTTVPLKLEPWGTVFVVFWKGSTASGGVLSQKIESRVATIDGPWQVSFEPGRGAPPSVTLEKLISWSNSTDQGVKYFSGAGTYTKTVQAGAEWFKNGAALILDLGDVKNLAEVTVNGKSLGVVWHAPYRIDATSALKSGANKIQVKVINAWVNRLIGDQQPNATTKYTFTDVKPYQATSPLLKSGLLGPVEIISVTSQ